MNVEEGGWEEEREDLSENYLPWKKWLIWGLCLNKDVCFLTPYLFIWFKNLYIDLIKEQGSKLMNLFWKVFKSFT